MYLEIKEASAWPLEKVVVIDVGTVQWAKSTLSLLLSEDEGLAMNGAFPLWA